MTDIATIPEIGHDEAMAWATAEFSHLLAAVDEFAEEDWTRPTDCDARDVEALLSHVLGSMEANASFRDFARQFRGTTKAAKRNGTEMLDEMTAAQVRDPPRWPRPRSASGSTTSARRRYAVGAALRRCCEG